MNHIMYCIHCHAIHRVTVRDTVFKTGFRLVNGQDVPLGICNGKTQSEKKAE
ncbi:DUF3973 domain-containing protein [Alicyclobacillus dauci]|uniref:DUF3973 domain-containing protein n=1 Tax=Alicyclobacillus dauci TaxID=1475485 RepID=A0ABY6ZAI4_9BACL|nr:DUF3973 domain-containing protein [Alicyclobacillus dauci]WAH39483.1 DUF3973 domain-containing protein [Alicyclobacillus dauci]WAH39543.1 DUF3973 domain-containing protein [Alicyclobacillus dauci]